MPYSLAGIGNSRVGWLRRTREAGSRGHGAGVLIRDAGWGEPGRQGVEDVDQESSSEMLVA